MCFFFQDVLRQRRCHRNNIERSNDTRHCDRSMFDIVAYDKYDSSSLKVFQCDHSTKELTKLKDFNQMNDRYTHFNVSYYKGHIYACIILAHKLQMQIAKYCLKSNKWKLLRRLKGLVLLEMSFCNFLDELFLVGGYVFSNNVSGESGVCLGFNTVNHDVRILSSMNEARCSAACAVFKEKVVISGDTVTTLNN